jgi:hypothetical protein
VEGGRDFISSHLCPKPCRLSLIPSIGLMSTNIRWRLHVANASSTRRLLVTDAPLRQLACQTSRRLQLEAALARMQHEQECCARALQAPEQRRQAPAVRAKDIANEANQRKAAALRQRLRLVLSESVAERERQREAAARHDGAIRAAESAALALVKDCRRHEAAMQAELSSVSSFANERSRPKIASSNLFDTARARIQATCELLSAPQDAILANIEHEDIDEEEQYWW